MIRVRMLKTAAGPFGSFAAGSTPELDADTALAFIEAGAAEAFAPRSKKVEKPEALAARTDAELLAQFEAEVSAAGYAEPGVKAIARARLLALREDIPYDEASRKLAAEEVAPQPSAPSTEAAATTDDPEELERHQMFTELVAGGTPEDEARRLIWPENVPEVERAIRTAPETAVAPAQRPPRRR